MGIGEEMKKALVEVLKVKMVPHPVKIIAEIKLTCYTHEGIDAIKFALREGQSLSTEEIPLKFSYVSSPIYEISTKTIKKNEGLNLIWEATRKVEQAIKSRQGNFILKTKVFAYYLAGSSWRKH